MSNIHFSNQKGIALFQVLLISAIISILAIQFTQTAKNQIKIASIMADRVTANMNLKTEESNLLFSLLTETRDKNNIRNNENKANKKIEIDNWNFYGKPFNVNENVWISIQDQNSLISTYKGYSAGRFENLLNNLIKNSATASVISQSLIDWQDIDSLARVNGAEKQSYAQNGFPTNLPLQSLSELKQVNQMTPEIFNQIQPYLTIRPQSYFNPINSPKEVLNIIFNKQIVDKVISLRENGKLNFIEFSNLTGLEQEEGIFFSTSGLLKIIITSSLNDVKISKTIELLIQPYNNYPYIEYYIEN